MSGAEDRELRGKAGDVWQELDMPAKRRIVVADVESAYHANELQWNYDFIYGKVLREFPPSVASLMNSWMDTT